MDAGAFTNLLNTVIRLVVQAAVAVAVLAIAWKFLGVLFSGGNEHAVRRLVLSLVLIGMAVAALGNLNQTYGIVVGVGAAVWSALAQSVQGAV